MDKTVWGNMQHMATKPFKLDVMFARCPHACVQRGLTKHAKIKKISMSETTLPVGGMGGWGILWLTLPVAGDDI